MRGRIDVLPPRSERERAAGRLSQVSASCARPGDAEPFEPRDHAAPRDAEQLCGLRLVPPHVVSASRMRRGASASTSSLSGVEALADLPLRSDASAVVASLVRLETFNPIFL